MDYPKLSYVKLVFFPKNKTTLYLRHINTSALSVTSFFKGLHSTLQKKLMVYMPAIWKVEF